MRTRKAGRAADQLGVGLLFQLMSYSYLPGAPLGDVPLLLLLPPLDDGCGSLTVSWLGGESVDALAFPA
jgi:hypothetical protein